MLPIFKKFFIIISGLLLCGLAVSAHAGNVILNLDTFNFPTIRVTFASSMSEKDIRTYFYFYSASANGPCSSQSCPGLKPGVPSLQRNWVRGSKATSFFQGIKDAVTAGKPYSNIIILSMSPSYNQGFATIFYKGKPICKLSKNPAFISKFMNGAQIINVNVTPTNCVVAE